MSSLPKTAPKEVLAEFKELGATLRKIVKAQTIRLENLMVRQHRWAVQHGPSYSRCTPFCCQWPRG